MPDWAPFEPPKAPDGAPNVVYIVLDDVGFSAMSCYGGPIETPNIDRIAADGVRYTQWHTTALCSPTRSCLLTGRNHTRNSMACITEAAIGFPNASGTIPPENGMLPEILGELGWNTYMVGKWHLCPTVEMNLASTRRNWPSGRGFERWYGFLGAETNQWYPDLVYDNHPVDQPKSPEEGYHLTEDLTDKAIEFIRDAKAVAPDKPFFLYYAPGAATRRTTSPKEWVDKFKGRFDMGYEAMREQTLARQKEMGIVPADTELPPINPIGTPETRTGPDGKPFPPLDVTRPWDSLSRRREAAVRRMAEVYAGFLAHADHHIGRLLDYLEETGQRENTLVILVSDNGASGEGGPNGSVNEMKFVQRHPRRHRRRTWRCSTSSAARRPTTTTRTAGRWRSTRRSRCGSGTSSTAARATRASSPGRPGRRRGGEIRHQYHHAIDIVPDHPGRPRRRAAGDDQGPRAEPLRRREHALQLRRRRPRRRPGRRSSTRCSARAAIWHDGWKAVTTHPTISGWSHFNDDTWELYHTDIDRSELHDLAAEQPDKLRELVNLWFAEAGANGAFPLDDRSALEIILTPRPQLTAAARPLRLLPRHRRGPRGAGGEHPQPLLHDRRAGRHPGAGRAGRAVRARVARSAGTPSTSRTTGCTTSTTSSACSEQKVDGDRGRSRPART